MGINDLCKLFSLSRYSLFQIFATVKNVAVNIFEDADGERGKETGRKRENKKIFPLCKIINMHVGISIL